MVRRQGHPEETNPGGHTQHNEGGAAESNGWREITGKFFLGKRPAKH